MEDGANRQGDQQPEEQKKQEKPNKTHRNQDKQQKKLRCLFIFGRILGGKTVKKTKCRRKHLEKPHFSLLVYYFLLFALIFASVSFLFAPVEDGANRRGDQQPEGLWCITGAVGILSVHI